jgi:DNA-directed RNA polymerase sigma subunit (sigma70/sigma32)
MRNCAKECFLTKTNCENKECRLFIEYEEDLNCTILAVNKHGPMTLEEIGRRHHISTVRAKQILDATLIKLKKTLLRTNTI